MGKIGLILKICLLLLVAAGVVSLITFGLFYVDWQRKTPTLPVSILLTVLSVVATVIITWMFSRRVAHKELRRAAARAVMLIENTEKAAAALLDKARQESEQASEDLQSHPDSKKMMERSFGWLIYSLERLKGRISDGRDDWRDFLPKEFEQQRELQAEENELRAQRDASAAQLEEMLAVETSKSEEVRELAEKLENLEDRLGNIEATPSPITGAPREAPVRGAEYWFMQGLLHSARRRHREAIEAYDKAIERRRDYPAAWNNKGNALARLGRVEKRPELFHEAIECYDKALELRKNYPAAWYNKGTVLTGLGRLENRSELFHKAIECYDKALELRKNYPAAWYNKGNALAGLGRVEKRPELFHEAIECYDKALELRKDYPAALNNKGNALASLGRVEKKPELFHEAIECYDKALELTEFRDSTAWYNKACAFARLKEKDKMLEALREAVRLDAEFKEKAKKDEAFKAYWEDEDFKAIVK